VAVTRRRPPREREAADRHLIKTMTAVALETAPRFTCGEVRGGNHPIHELVELPGIRGVLYSSPCGGARGGDVHYLSICGSGLLSRLCLADVAGHGETVEAVGREMHACLRRSVDMVDQRRVLSALDARLVATGLSAQTTAALATYYPPSRRLSVSYAGHPPGWIYRGADRRWAPLVSEAPSPRAGLVDLPLGTGLGPSFARHRFVMNPGDRVLLVTDGVLEAAAPDGAHFGDSALTALLAADTSGDLTRLATTLLEALHAHTGADRLVHDDVSFLLLEIVPGPPGPALWHVVKNRLLGGGRR
jgi:sigma-B regulation protein RsbU (phosphoserine phosphatase)